MNPNEQFTADLLQFVQELDPETAGAFRLRDITQDDPARVAIVEPLPGDVFASIGMFCDVSRVPWLYDPEPRDGDGYPDLVFDCVGYDRQATAATLAELTT